MIRNLIAIGRRLRSIVGLNENSLEAQEQPVTPSIDPDRLTTPLTPGAVEQAAASVDALLTSEDRSLVELLNGVQEYVERHEYVDRHGNAFFERLVERANDPDSLIEIVEVRDDTVWFVCPADVWAELTHELDVTDREAVAVADAHQMHANRIGLEAYAPNVRIMCVSVDDLRVQDLVGHTGMQNLSE